GTGSPRRARRARGPAPQTAPATPGARRGRSRAWRWDVRYRVPKAAARAPTTARRRSSTAHRRARCRPAGARAPSARSSAPAGWRRSWPRVRARPSSSSVPLLPPPRVANSLTPREPRTLPGTARRLGAPRRAGATVRFAEPDPETLELPVEAIEAVLSEHTRWVAVTAASNAVGTVPDVQGIVALAHEAGARTYVDAVHATPHRRLDVAALDT